MATTQDVSSAQGFFRSEFPYAGEVVYLDSASIGLVPLCVKEEVRAFEECITGRGTGGLTELAEAGVYDSARTAAADLLGANVDDIAIVTSASEALCQIAWWLRPGAGANVVSADIEFPSVTYPWLRVARDFGTEVRLVEARQSPADFSVDRLAKRVDARTAAICISHVQYATGYRIDLQELSLLARNSGALLVVDATQSGGVTPIDVRSCRIDFLVCSSYKWLCGPFGAAFCYVNPEIRERFTPPFVGWHGVSDPFAFDATSLRLSGQARSMEYATVAYSAGLGMAAGVRYLLATGIHRIESHVLHLGQLLIDGLLELGADVVTPQNSSERAGIVSARFPSRDSGTLVQTLRERGVYAASRLGFVRFSPHYYNNENDVRHTLFVLAQEMGFSKSQPGTRS